MLDKLGRLADWLFKASIVLCVAEGGTPSTPYHIPITQSLDGEKEGKVSRKKLTLQKANPGMFAQLDFATWSVRV